MVPFLLQNAPLIIYGLAMIGGFCFGYKRGFCRSLWHLLFHGVRIVGAVVLTKILSEKVLGYLFHQIQVWAIGTDLYSLFADPQTVHLIQIPIQMVMNLALFILLMLLLAIVCKPLEVLTRAILFLPKKKWKLLGGAVGVVSGFVILTAFVVPFGGIVNLGHTVSMALTVDTAQQESPATMPTPALAYQTTEPIASVALGKGTEMGNMLFAWDDSLAMRMHRKAGGEFLFHYLTEVEYNGKTYSLTHEVQTSTELISCIRSLYGVKAQNWTQKQVDHIEALCDTFNQSDLLPSLTLSLLHSANDNWNQGKLFLGIMKPNVGEVLQPTFELVLNAVANGTEADLKHSLTTISDVMQVMYENGGFAAFASDDTTKAMLDVLAKDTVREQLMASLQADHNLRICIPEMFRLSVRVAEKDLGLETDEIITDVATAINAVKEAETVEARKEALVGELQQVSDTHNLEVPEVALQYVSDFLIEQFDDFSQVETEDINEWLESYATEILANGIPENMQQWFPNATPQA